MEKAQMQRCKPDYWRRTINGWDAAEECDGILLASVSRDGSWEIRHRRRSVNCGWKLVKAGRCKTASGAKRAAWRNVIKIKDAAHETQD
jgi:hypothetical protein